MQAIIVCPDTKTIEEVEIAKGFEALQKAVGGWIEGIYPEIAGKATTVYVDEEGRFKANVRWKLCEWELLGKAVILGPPSAAGNDTKVCVTPEEVKAAITW